MSKQVGYNGIKRYGSIVQFVPMRFKVFDMKKQQVLPALIVIWLVILGIVFWAERTPQFQTGSFMVYTDWLLIVSAAGTLIAYRILYVNGQVSLKKNKRMMELIESMNRSLSFNELLNYIYKSFAPYVPYDYIGICLVKEEKGKRLLIPSFGISGGKVTDLPQGLLPLRVPIDKTSLESLILSNEPRIINDYREYVKKRPTHDYTRIVMSAGIKSSITFPISVRGNTYGFIFFSSIKRNVYREKHKDFLRLLANSINLSFEKSVFLDSLLYSSLLALAKMAEAKDEVTGDHLDRMQVYACALGDYLLKESAYSQFITPQFMADLERFSPMHDIGKVGVRDAILMKPGKLTPEEFDEMKKHAVYGADVMREAESHIMKSGRSLFGMGIEITESHHEKWDGTGYPKGLKQKEIPLSARIVALVDVLDALTSKRPYKEAFPYDQSAEIIAQGSGKHFDPELVRVFLNHREDFKELCLKLHEVEGEHIRTA